MAEALGEDARLAARSVLNPEYFAGKTVAVLGASGFLGRVLSMTLHELGADVLACGRSAEKLSDIFADTCTTQVLDVSAGPLEFVRVPDVIIHAASPADPASFAATPVQTMLSNVTGVQHVLDYAAQQDVQRVLYISSGEVYGYAPSECVAREEDLFALDLTSPRSCYPQAKRAGETLCASYAAQYGVDVRIARPSHVLGPEFSASDSRASAAFFRDAANSSTIELTSSGEQMRTFVYVTDAVSGMLSVLSAGKAGEAYNVTNTRNAVSFAQFACEVGRVGGVDVRIPEPSGQAPERVRIAQLDDTKLRSLGWTPRISFEQAVERTYALLS